MADPINSKKHGGINKHYTNEQSGIKIDSGPYIGIVKNNSDPARLGRLQVYIPDIGGDPSQSANWFTVTYASPFAGTTIGTASPQENIGNEKQTYGFWAVPPDLENQVLVTFVMGDASRGYWFACLPNAESRHMTPGVSRLPAENTIIKDDQLTGRQLDSGEVFLPASEVNLNSRESSLRGDMLTLKRVAHTAQSETVIQQGLETDSIRGTITSSSQREAPSRVFGFSTPGRPDPDLANIYRDLEGKEAAKKVVDDYINNVDTRIDNNLINTPPGRSGGHTLVMDDGDVYGDNDLVRLRTAGGHTILMHDTENIIYITNKKGNAWIELTADGAVNVYNTKSFSLRSEANVNIHADGNVNIHAGDSINCFAEKRIETETHIKREKIKQLHNIDTGSFGLLVGSDTRIKTLNAHIETERFLRMHSGTTSGWTVKSGEMQLTGGSDIHLNTAGKSIRAPENPESNAPFEQYQKQDVKFDTAIRRWVIDEDSTLKSIAHFTPTHEPWSRESGPQQLNDGTLKPSQQQKDE